MQLMGTASLIPCWVTFDRSEEGKSGNIAQALALVQAAGTRTSVKAKVRLTHCTGPRLEQSLALA